MGKKRIIKKSGGEGGAAAAGVRSSKRKLSEGILFVEATYNNTKVSVADMSGNVVAWSSAGSLGFSGAKKGTPFAAAKVGETLGERAQGMGLKEVAVIIKGVGAGRESSVRGFASKGIELRSIKDVTPVPHGGVRPRKARRI